YPETGFWELSRGKRRPSSQRSLVKKRRPAGPPRDLERLREPAFHEFPQLGRGPELWDRIQFFECRRKRIGKTPDRSWSEFLVFRLEVQVVHGAGEVLGSFEFTLHKCLVDDHLGGDVGEFAPLPGFHCFLIGSKLRCIRS